MVINTVDIMKKPHHPSFAALLPAALLIITAPAASGQVRSRDIRIKEEVTIAGQLYAEGTDLDNAVLVVELEGDLCLRSYMLRNGRFHFGVPVGAQARLIFLKPGFHTKEVLVDTHNAMCTERARQRNDKVKFNVILERCEAHPMETYAGPVGSIHFVKGTGVMRVVHDERMMAVLECVPSEW